MNKTPIWLKPWEKALTAGKGIDPDALKDRVIELLLREENNLIQVNGNNEVYVDLQLPAWIKPTDDFPVWVTTGKILQADWWQQSWLILNWKTTSGDYNRLIYANDGKLYIDKGNGVWVELGGWGCDCHNVSECSFRSYDDEDPDNELIVTNTVNSTPPAWTIIAWYWFITNGAISQLQFGNDTPVDIIYYWNSVLDKIYNPDSYPDIFFTWIIAQWNKFVVWNVKFSPWA